MGKITSTYVNLGELGAGVYAADVSLGRKAPVYSISVINYYIGDCFLLTRFLLETLKIKHCVSSL
jgi:hypothetical protein